MIEEIKGRIEELQSSIEKVKAEFRAVITNKDIPLDERWDFFVRSPDILKEHQNWIAHFDIEKETDFSYYDDFYFERYQTIHTSDLVERVEEREKFANYVVPLKEEILHKNLGGFQYDW